MITTANVSYLNWIKGKNSILSTHMILQLLIMKKVEDLKDEVEEVLDGIDLNSSFIHLRSLE